MSGVKTNEDLQRLIKSRRWVDAGELMTLQRSIEKDAAMFHNIPTRYDAETGDMVVLNSTDLILKKHKIIVYNKIDDCSIVMNDRVKTIISQVLHSTTNTQANNLKNLIEQLLGTDEFIVTVEPI